MIAVTFALPAESSEFARLFRKDERVSIIHTGVGRKAAAQRVGAALAGRERPRLLISAGFAGGLSDALRVGDLLLAENFSDPTALADSRARLAAVTHRIGMMATAEAIADTPAERSKLAAESRAIAVDMETEEIAQVCHAAGVPMLSLRVITDTPSQPLPAPAAVLFNVEQQRTEFAPLAFYLLKNPARVAPLITFAKRIAACRRALAAALALLLRPPLR